MLVVNKSQVSLVDGALIAEASTLGIGPGRWPQFISVVNDKNEGYLFLRSLPQYHNGELDGYIYTTKGGDSLMVFND